MSRLPVSRTQVVLVTLATLVSLLMAWSAMPPRRPLVPAVGLSPAVRLAVVIEHPTDVWARINASALVDGLFDYDPTAAAGELSATAQSAGLPALEPPVRLNSTERQQVSAALHWLQPTQAAVVQIDRGEVAETWLGMQGARVRLLGRLAAWFTDRCVCGDNIWVRLDRRGPNSVWPAATSVAWDWPRAGDADVAAVFPRGLPQALPTGDLAREARQAEQRARLQAVLDAARLPVDCRRLELNFRFDGSRLAWDGWYRGSAPSAWRWIAPDAAPRGAPRLPPPSQPGVFLTLYADLAWAPLYRNLQAAMSEEERVDFARSMRWYRMIEDGYSDPEGDFLAPLGRGVAAVGRRGTRYNDIEWMPSVRAEVPLKPPAQGLLNLLRDTPNEKFRRMMPAFAEARFDKIRQVGESRYDVHPSYVAVTLRHDHDRYVLMRPTIAGSALMPAWQVDERRVVFGTRPDVLDDGNLFAPLPPQPVGSTLVEATREAGRLQTVFSLYFDPAAVVDQLDNFRILVKVEAGSDRPKPEDGLTVERIEAENKRVVAATVKNMRQAAQVGWVLTRIGPLELQVSTEAAGDEALVRVSGSVGLRQR